MIHTHQLSTTNHQQFLSEGREDPITGEKLLAGDEIVFCASCQSAFLRDSWTYIGEQHCGQTETLSEVPVSKTLRIRSDWKLDKLLWKSSHVTHERVINMWSNLFFYLLIAPWLVLAIVTSFMMSSVAITVAILIFCGIPFTVMTIAMISGFMTNTRKGAYANIKRLSIFRNGLLVNKKRSIKLSQIKQVFLETVHNPRGNKNYYIYLLEIFLHDGTSLKFEPATTESGGGVDIDEVQLFYGLARFAYYVPVSFSIHAGQEANYLHRLRENVGTQFELIVRDEPTST